MIPTYADPPETRRRLRLALLLSAVLSMAAVALMVLLWAVAFSMSVPLVQLQLARNDETAAEMVR